MADKVVQLLYQNILDERNVVSCTECGGEYLHQIAAEVYFRKEDAATGRHVTVRYERVDQDESMCGNPSSRRDGIRLFFECEICHGVHAVVIVQHKGRTFLTWEYVEHEKKVLTEGE